MSVRARWEWRLEDSSGHAVERPGSPVFDARVDAEEWLGDHWRTLAAQHVAVAVLLNEGESVPPPVAIPAGPVGSVD